MTGRELGVVSVASGRVSKTMDSKFAARSFIVMAEDELNLERFLKRIGG
jgi:hypothetical protein